MSIHRSLAFDHYAWEFRPADDAIRKAGYYEYYSTRRQAALLGVALEQRRKTERAWWERRLPQHLTTSPKVR